MNWSGCELVEIVPGKVSGRPIIKGTRILADTIVVDHQLGESIDEIHDNYPSLAHATIEKLLSYARFNDEQTH